MKRRMRSRVFFIMGLLVMDLCCASCGINGTEEISPVAESTSLLIDLKTSSSATSSSPATFKTTVSAYTTPSTTAPKTTASAYTAPETPAQNPYEGEMAKIYEQPYGLPPLQRKIITCGIPLIRIFPCIFAGS